MNNLKRIISSPELENEIKRSPDQAILTLFKMIAILEEQIREIRDQITKTI